MTQEWLYRVMSKKTADWCFKDAQNELINFTLKHPSQWGTWGDNSNLGSSFLRQVDEEFNHVGLCSFPSVPVPAPFSLPDPMEGMTIEKVGITRNKDRLAFVNCSPISSRVRSICFSYAECTEQELHKLIGQALCRYDATAYIYAPLDDMVKLFFENASGVNETYTYSLSHHPVRYLMLSNSKNGFHYIETPNKDTNPKFQGVSVNLGAGNQVISRLEKHIEYMEYITRNLKKLGMYREEQEQRITTYILNEDVSAKDITFQCNYSELDIRTGWGTPTL